MPRLVRASQGKLPGQLHSRWRALFAAWRYDLAGPLSLSALGDELSGGTTEVALSPGGKAWERQSRLEEADKQHARRDRNLGRRLYAAVGVLPWAAFPGGKLPDDWHRDGRFCQAVDEWRLAAIVDPVRKQPDDFTRQLDSFGLAVDPDALERMRSGVCSAAARVLPEGPPQVMKSLRETALRALLAQHDLEHWEPAA